MSNTAKNFLRSLVLVLPLAAPVALAEDGAGSVLPAGAASDLLYQLETLQVEVQTLRGIIERQQHELDKMRDSQRDRYIDLDKRISLVMSQMSEVVSNQNVRFAAPNDAYLNSGTSTVGLSGGAVNSTIPSDNASNPTGPIDIEPTTPEIQAAYKASYDLIRSKEYEKAAESFTQFISIYPNTDLTGNSYYWLGQLKLVLGDPKDALAKFDTVVNRFPGHNKEADAIYKLGLVNDQLNNKIAAKRHLIDVIERFPVSDAAKLAKKYLSSMK